MQLISIASLRRAADRVGKTGPVTEERIAQELDVELRVVTHYIKGVTNLKSELGLEKKQIPNAEYVAALRRLQEHGLLVTIRRIAYLTCSTERNTAAWVRRHPVDAKWISYKCEVARYAIAQRARWNACSCRNDLGRLNKTRLAHKVGMERAMFCRFLKKWPTLWVELENKR